MLLGSHALVASQQLQLLRELIYIVCEVNQGFHQLIPAIHQSLFSLCLYPGFCVIQNSSAGPN